MKDRLQYFIKSCTSNWVHILLVYEWNTSIAKLYIQQKSIYFLKCIFLCRKRVQNSNIKCMFKFIKIKPFLKLIKPFLKLILRENPPLYWGLRWLNHWMAEQSLLAALWYKPWTKVSSKWAQYKDISKIGSYFLHVMCSSQRYDSHFVIWDIIYMRNTYQWVSY